MRRPNHRIQPVIGAGLRAIAAGFAALLTHCSDVDCPHYTDEINDRCVVKQPNTADESAATSAGVGAPAFPAVSPAAGAGGMSQIEGGWTGGNGGTTGSESGTGGAARASSAGTSGDTSASTAGNASPQEPSQAGAGSGPMQNDSGPSSSGASAAGHSANDGTAGTPASPCTPDNERCDNIDNDCDGKIDEEVPPRPCGKNTPPCKQGGQSCAAGVWSTECVGEVRPTEEVCDGVDNDCSGAADEGCDCTNGDTMPCGTRTPPCRQGTKTCTDGAWPTECPGEIKPTDEVCDGVDNDCDGTLDDGGDALCTGGKSCAGTARCVECVSNADCAGRQADTCQVYYCDTQLHQCRQRAAERGSSCSTIANGKCDGTRCVACISAADCPTGHDCSANLCVKRAACGDGQIDSGETCDNGRNNGDDNDCTSECKLNRCGDGKWNSKGMNREECEVGARSSFSDGRAWDEWSCNQSSCQRRYAYTPCSSDGDCSGDRCNGAGGCVKECSLSNPEIELAPNNCEAIPGRGGMCYGGCIAECSGGKRCPPGYTCTDRFGLYPDGTQIYVCTL